MRTGLYPKLYKYIRLNEIVTLYDERGEIVGHDTRPLLVRVSEIIAVKDLKAHSNASVIICGNTRFNVTDLFDDIAKQIN